MEDIYNELIIGIDKDRVLINEPMKKHTTFKVGGPADIFVKLNSIEELKFLLEICRKQNVPVSVIGNGSNVLVKDNGIRGVCVKLDFKQISKENDNIICAQAGVLLSKIARFVLEESLSGFEFASGIPGTLGGAVYMNAGAYGKQLSDVILSTTYIDENLEIKTINNLEHNFSYRKSIFQENKWIIISSKIVLENGTKEEIAKKMEDYSVSRKTKQPLNMPSAGSTFKRGNDFIAAELIDKCGLKGYKVGDAEVSTMHAGFIVNNGNATAEDILTLAEIVKQKVKEKFGKTLDLEVEILGE